MHRALAAALASFVLVLAAAAPGDAASFPADSTLVLSGTPDLLHPPTDGSTTFLGSLSSDGRYAAYASFTNANGVLSEPVMRRDLVTGQLTTVSVAQDGTPLSLIGVTSAPPQISGDGQHVVFEAVAVSMGQLTEHVYERDLSTNPPRTLIADRFADSGTVDTDSFRASDPTVSDDGSRVAFVTSNPLDPVADRDQRRDVYVRDFKSNETILVDRAAGELAAKADAGVGAQGTVISGDGQHVVFDTTNPLDPAHDTGTDEDVYVRNLDTFTTTLASVAGVSDKGDNSSAAVGISRDGNRVLFASDATTFGVSYASEQLYVRDIKAHTLELASRANGAGGAAVGTIFSVSEDNALSADGRHVVWAAEPPNATTQVAPGAPTDSALRVYERDLSNGNPSGGVTRLISRATGPSGAAGDGNAVVSIGGVTADGGCVAFSDDGTVLTPPGSTMVTYEYLRALEPDCGRSAPGPGPGPGPSPRPGPGPGPGPVNPALLSGLSLQPARFFVGGAKGGTRIAFRLDKASGVTLSFDRLLAGRLTGRRCTTTARTGKRCTLVRHAGSLTVAAGRAGSNTLKFSGKLGRRALAPGSYRLTATPSHGKPVSVRFTVVKAPKSTRKASR